MKTKVLLLMCAVMALVACSNDDNDSALSPTTQTAEPTPFIKFNLTATHADDETTAQTRAVKTGWEAGDAIFVFFSGAAAPKHLKMIFDGTSWTSAEYNGATQTAGALGLKNGDTGTMRAVFLPFGSDATVAASGTSFTFSTTYYAYYLTATLDYTVADNEVSGSFNMMIPDDYVQFFVEDAAATDGGYTLGTDAVIPVGVASITADGTITETSDKVAGNDMPGYAYSGGYLFSGKLTSWGYGSNYYFAKTKTADNSRADYFVTGKTLASHSAVKLPANDNVYEVKSGSPNNGKWVPVGSDITVSLYKVTGSGISEEVSPLGKWHTCNYGQAVPESLGEFYTFNGAKVLGVTLPTKDQFALINNSSNCSYIWLTVHGQQGVVIKAPRGFLFLQAQYGSDGGYWSSTERDGNIAWYFYFNSGGGHDVNFATRTHKYAVRPFQN